MLLDACNFVFLKEMKNTIFPSNNSNKATYKIITEGKIRFDDNDDNGKMIFVSSRSKGVYNVYYGCSF